MFAGSEKSISISVISTSEFPLYCRLFAVILFTFNITFFISYVSEIEPVKLSPTPLIFIVIIPAFLKSVVSLSPLKYSTL